ncbi:MAG: RHS repeat-associated core domain-containing protein [Acinetobacter sp.]
MRTQKTVNGVVTDYTLHGKLVTGLKQGANSLHFFYDKDSRPQMVAYNGTLYTYVHNLQGDIIAIVDNVGTKVVEYKYDVWGKPIGDPWTLTITYEALATLNPFRYRGYVYDTETGLYYLRSRYYNPDWGRFINSDNLLGPGILSSM